MKQLSLLILVVLSVAFFTLLTPSLLNPELYTIYNESSTSYHSDPATLWEYSYERSSDIQIMMQELLDAPQPIVLNIKIKDFEEARREFEEYEEKSRYFNEVVVNLDLTDSALGDFRRENRKNIEALERMINDSARFDEINRLEIHYRSEDNPTLLYTIAFEGEAVHNSLKKSTSLFAEREPDFLEISKDLDLNTTQYQEAIEMLEEIVEEDRRKQEERELNRPALPFSGLSLSVSPDSGQYGDSLQVAGAYTFFRIQEVTLVLDSRDWKTVIPDANGVFSTTLPIDRIREGEHVMFATSGQLYSNLATFTVVPTDTVLTLEAYTEDERWDEVICYGELRAGTIPVSTAPVRILVDDIEAMKVETDLAGYYVGSLNLTQGNHTLQAVFNDAAFPLNPSESAVQTITLAPVVPLLLIIIVGSGVLTLASLSSMWYLRRRNLPAIPVESSPLFYQEVSLITPTYQESEDMYPGCPTPGDILIHYQNLFDNGEWSHAAALLYHFIVSRITHLPMASDIYSLTPRETACLLSETSVGETFRAFISRYEEVRYGGLPLQQLDILLSHWNAILAAFEVEKELGGRS
jgi:hypothetical protein